jgi:hypothetical protein
MGVVQMEVDVSRLGDSAKRQRIPTGSVRRMALGADWFAFRALHEYSGESLGKHTHDTLAARRQDCQSQTYANLSLPTLQIALDWSYLSAG